MIFFTSDEHYDHRNIISLSGRPFSDLDEMREEMISRHNSRVQTGDLVYHLGDFCLTERNVQPVLSRLNGSHILIAGNHDACHVRHRKVTRVQDRYVSYGFLDVMNEYFLGQLHLHHMPYFNPAAPDQRYAQYRPKREPNTWLLHGHVHELWKTKDYMINCGVDQWNFAPVSIDEIYSLIGELVG